MSKRKPSLTGAPLVWIGLTLAFLFLRPVTAHPHGNVPLLKYRDRLVAFLATKGGSVAVAACEARLGPAAGRVGATLSRWAARGQVDLVMHVLRHRDDERHDVPACEICSILRHDAAHGDPAAITLLKPSATGILPVTAHGFLTAARPGFRWQVPDTAREPGDGEFLPLVIAADHWTLYGVGCERIDLDGDGAAETQRTDTNGDGSFDSYHIDRDRDGVFEVGFERAESGLWKFIIHDRLLRQLRRAEQAVKPAGGEATE